MENKVDNEMEKGDTVVFLWEHMSFCQNYWAYQGTIER